MSKEMPLDPIRVQHSGYVRIDKIVDGEDGCLCVVESNHDVPFAIKRVYFINHLDDQKIIRGKHAHKQLQQVIFCIQGSFNLQLDDGTVKQTIAMTRDDTGIILGANLWHTMTNFSPGSVLLVLASDHFNANDYIRDYDAFLRHIGSIP